MVAVKYKVWYYKTVVHRPIKTGEVGCLLPEESYSLKRNQNYGMDKMTFDNGIAHSLLSILVKLCSGHSLRPSGVAR